MKVVSEIFSSKPDPIHQEREQSPTKEMEIEMFEFPDFDNFMHLETEGSDKWVQLGYSTRHLLNTV